MKTFSAKPADVVHDWYVVDAAGNSDAVTTYFMVDNSRPIITIFDESGGPEIEDYATFNPTEAQSGMGADPWVDPARIQCSNNSVTLRARIANDGLLNKTGIADIAAFPDPPFQSRVAPTTICNFSNSPATDYFNLNDPSLIGFAPGPAVPVAPDYFFDYYDCTIRMSNIDQMKNVILTTGDLCGPIDFASSAPTTVLGQSRYDYSYLRYGNRPTLSAGGRDPGATPTPDDEQFNYTITNGLAPYFQLHCPTSPSGLPNFTSTAPFRCLIEHGEVTAGGADGDNQLYTADERGQTQAYVYDICTDRAVAQATANRDSNDFYCVAGEYYTQAVCNLYRGVFDTCEDPDGDNCWLPVSSCNDADPQDWGASSTCAKADRLYCATSGEPCCTSNDSNCPGDCMAVTILPANSCGDFGMSTTQATCESGGNPCLADNSNTCWKECGTSTTTTTLPVSNCPIDGPAEWAASGYVCSNQGDRRFCTGDTNIPCCDNNGAYGDTYCSGQGAGTCAADAPSGECAGADQGSTGWAPDNDSSSCPAGVGNCAASVGGCYSDCMSSCNETTEWALPSDCESNTDCGGGAFTLPKLAFDTGSPPNFTPNSSCTDPGATGCYTCPYTNRCHEDANSDCGVSGSQEMNPGNGSQVIACDPTETSGSGNPGACPGPYQLNCTGNGGGQTDWQFTCGPPGPQAPGTINLRIRGWAIIDPRPTPVVPTGSLRCFHVVDNFPQGSMGLASDHPVNWDGTSGGGNERFTTQNIPAGTQLTIRGYSLNSRYPVNNGIGNRWYGDCDSVSNVGGAQYCLINVQAGQTYNIEFSTANRNGPATVNQNVHGIPGGSVCSSPSNPCIDQDDVGNCCQFGGGQVRFPQAGWSCSDTGRLYCYNRQADCQSQGGGPHGSNIACSEACKQ